MVTPVLHVLPLTICSTHVPMIALLLRAFRTFCEGQGVTMPFVDEAFSQSTAAKNFLACGALKLFFHFRLRRA